MDKNQYTKKFYEKYKEFIEKESDLYGNEPPSFLFPILSTLFGHLMEEDPKKAVSKIEVILRRPLHKVIQIVGPMFLPCKQVIENKKQLEDPTSKEKDTELSLSKEPVIWAPNHCFQEDILSTLTIVPRAAYILVGNTARAYNDIEGIPLLANGTILVNRNNKKSRRASFEKCKRVLDLGTDLVMFPEGVRNKTPNALSLNLFSGIYRLAKEKNCKIIPIIHYKEDFFKTDKSSIIHTVIADPVDVSSMNMEEALQTLKDIYAYWQYLLMEKYGQSTRKQELKGAKQEDYWEGLLQNRTLSRYDIEEEKKASYYPKREQEYYQALEDISSLEITTDNIKIVENAKKLIKSNFQRRY